MAKIRAEELAGSHVPTTAGFMSSITGGNLFVLEERNKNVSLLQIGVKTCITCLHFTLNIVKKDLKTLVFVSFQAL